VAVSLQLQGLAFEHRSVSVFRAFDEFHAINPVVKAPTLVCEDGTVLMDSSLILDYAQALGGRRSLMPKDSLSLRADLRVIGQMLPQLLPAAQFPALAAFCAQAEDLPQFRAAAHGDGTCIPVN